MTETEVDPRVITNFDTYDSEEITTSFRLLTGDVPVEQLKKQYAKAYMEEAYRENVHVPDEYYQYWWGIDNVNDL